jgi:hypothetical protein
VCVRGTTSSREILNQINEAPITRGRAELRLQKDLSVATSRNLGILFSCLLMCWMAVGCSSSNNSSANGSGSTTPPAGLQFTAPTAPPVIELSTPPQSVSLTVNQSVTWSYSNGSGMGKPVGQLTNETATSATYVAPASTGTINCIGQVNTPSTTEQVVVTATSTSDTTQSTEIAIIIVENSPCIATRNSITAATATLGTQTYTACPPQGTPMLYGGNNGQLMQAGTFASLQIGDAGFAAQPESAWGVAPFTWEISSGSLPTGMSLAPGTDTSNVYIEGTPVSAGCNTTGTTLQITDSTGATATQTYYFVVLPKSLAVQVPAYPSSFNIAESGKVSASDPGVPYPPTALVASGGTPPYVWSPDPTGQQTLAPGLNLNPSASSSNVAVISGTPAAGADGGSNLQSQQSGLYPSLFYANDSQQPYPAVGVANLANMAAVGVLPQPEFCSAATAAPPVTGDPNGVPANSYLQGSFAYLLRGFDANGPAVIAGSVTTDGQGNVTGGEEDITNSSGSQNFTVTSGNYIVGISSFSPSNPGFAILLDSYSRGCMTLNLNSAATGATTATTFAFSLGGCSNQNTENQLPRTSDMACGLMLNNETNVAAGYFTTGRIIEFDDVSGQGTRASGILRLQDTTSFSGGMSGPYAFGLSGWDFSAGHYALAGSLQASGSGLSAVAADIDDAGTLSSSLTGGSGTLTIPDANGRSTGSLSVGQATYDLALYTVGKNEMLVVSTDALSQSHPIIGGEALTTASSFSNVSLQNSQMFHIGGIAPSGPDVSIGVLAFDGVSSFSGTVYEDQAATLGTTSVSGAYAVNATTGRTIFTSQTNPQNPLGAHAFVGYVIPTPANFTRTGCSNPESCITGFLVGTDSTAQDGVLEFQVPVVGPPPPFNNRYVEGDYAYGTDEILDQDTPSLEGNALPLPNSSSTTSGSFAPSVNTPGEVEDVDFGSLGYCSVSTCFLLPSETFTGSYTINANGTGTFGGGTVSVTNGNVTFYIDESPVNSHPSVIVMEQ